MGTGNSYDHVTLPHTVRTGIKKTSSGPLTSGPLLTPDTTQPEDIVVGASARGDRCEKTCQEHWSTRPDVSRKGPCSMTCGDALTP
jgi:hypothetical protein